MKKSQKGFTIIEVALVLAVGALIFLVVFLAVPALQRNQRNDARKRDQAQVVEAITSYIANNPASPLVDADDVVYKDGKGQGSSYGKYIDTLSNNTEIVKVVAGDIPKDTDTSVPPQELRKTIYVKNQYVCTDNHKDAVKGSTRQAAVFIYNETAHGFDRLCSSAN